MTLQTDWDRSAIKVPAEVFRQLEPSWLEVVVRVGGGGDNYGNLLDELERCEQREVGRDKVVIRVPFDDERAIERLRPELASDRNIYCGLAFNASVGEVKDRRIEVYDQNSEPLRAYNVPGGLRWVKQKMMITSVVDDRGYLAAWQLNLREVPAHQNVLLATFDYRAGAVGKLVGLMNLFRGF